jgi:hypothetical protein
MSDDSTAGWMPPQQSGPQQPGRAEPVGAGAPGVPPEPAAPPFLPPAGGSGSSSVPPPPPPPPPPPGWSPAANADSSGDGAPGDGPIGERTTSSKKILVGAVVGVLAIGAAGVFAVTQMSGDNDGGAASPEELGEAVMESLDQEDMLGVIDLLLPGERDTFSEPAQQMVSELTRLEVLSDEASLDGLAGFDFSLEERDVIEEPTNVDDIVNITMIADATASINGDELPIGDLLNDAMGNDVDMDEFTGMESGLDFEVPMTAVEKDGRWYLSAFYTIAENARTSEGLGDIPVDGIQPAGGDSPEGAIDVMFDGIEQLDLTAIIAALNPNEAEALQRYAPLFIGEAQQALDEVPAMLEVTEVEYDVEGSGSTRSVSIEKVTVDGTLEENGESVSFSATFDDGCITADANGESFDSCVLQTEGDDLEEILGEIDGLDEFRTEMEDILDDYDQPGITVKEVDGQWYVSPIATWFDQFFAITEALDREEIDQAIEAVETIFFSVADVYEQDFDIYGSDEFEFEDVPASTIDNEFADETLPGDTSGGTVPGDADGGDTAPESTVVDDFAESDRLYQECVALPTAEEAAACMQGHVDSGAMEEYYMPIELRFLECGVGDVVLGITPEWELSDQDYTVILRKANECFTGLINSGQIEDFEVPAEYLRPECAEGRNPWAFGAPDEEEFFDRWLDCIYA